MNDLFPDTLSPADRILQHYGEKPLHSGLVGFWLIAIARREGYRGEGSFDEVEAGAIRFLLKKIERCSK